MLKLVTAPLWRDLITRGASKTILSRKMCSHHLSGEHPLYAIFWVNAFVEVERALYTCLQLGVFQPRRNMDELANLS